METEVDFMNNIYLLNTCDEWKSSSSMSCIMATTSLEKLRKGILQKIKDEDIEYKRGYDDITVKEQLAMFKSDFKIIADYFVKRRKIPEYRGSKDTIKHVDEFFKLMKILTNDNEIETVYNENIFTEQGGADMAGYFTTLINHY